MVVFLVYCVIRKILMTLTSNQIFKKPNNFSSKSTTVLHGKKAQKTKGRHHSYHKLRISNFIFISPHVESQAKKVNGEVPFKTNVC
jgi:hypothetical protein